MLNAELVEFGRCIEEKRPYPVAIDEVLHGMSVFDAVVRSARVKKRNRRMIPKSGNRFSDKIMRPRE